VNLPLIKMFSTIGSITAKPLVHWALPEKSEKKKLWEVDPNLYHTGKRASFSQRRIIPALRQVGKFGLLALLFTYPIYLIYIGLAFGFLAFWTFLAASMVVIGFVISRLGLASNFRNADFGLKRMIGVVLGFMVAAGWIVGVIYLKAWFVPTTFVLIGLGVFFAVRRQRS
jgi:hypothetical protein